MKIRLGSVSEAVELAKRIPDFSNPYNLNSPDTALPQLDHVLIAEDDGVPIGFRAGSRYSPDTFAVWLAAVLPNYRGQGIGGALYRSQKDWLKSQGYRFIRTHARNSNRAMLKILVDNDYQVVDVVSYGDLPRNKVVFVKNLWSQDAAMTAGSLIVGLLRGNHPLLNRDDQARLRDLSIAWLRFNYSGRIIEDASADAILDRAAHAGHRYCLILPHGTIVDDAGRPGWARNLETWADQQTFLTAGAAAVGSPANTVGVWLVDLQRYRDLTRPLFGDGGGLKVDRELPDSIANTFLHIAPENSQQAESLNGVFGAAIAIHSLKTGALSADQLNFLTAVQRQVRNAGRGVAIFDGDRLGDDRQATADFAGPVSTLYSVAQGLTADWLLHTHGCDENTRVIYFDSSSAALDFQRRLHAEWNGEDYPAFLRSTGFSPPEMTAAGVQEAWQREIERWGGESVIREHWLRVKGLSTQYVLCDLLDDPQPFLRHVDGRARSAISWGDAFSNVAGNWLHTIEQRRAIYERFVHALSERDPAALVYGRDYNHVALGPIRAADYSGAYFRTEENYLEPRKIPG